MGKLIMFYGTECTHCHEMMPLVEKLEKEKKLKVTMLEVWHDAKNRDLMMKYGKDKCLGIPFFFNENSKKHICGSTSYEELKKWAG